MLCRPSLAEVLEYRRWVDERVTAYVEKMPKGKLEERAGLIELGLNHEEQHQELMLTDILNVYASDPFLPAYCERESPPTSHSAEPVRWHEYGEGIGWIGHESEGFAFDNESPRHRQFVHAFRLASRPVTAGEFIALLVKAGLPVLPVGVAERGGRLRVSFGPLFVPQVPPNRIGLDRTVAPQVMAAIARQLPLATETEPGREGL